MCEARLIKAQDELKEVKAELMTLKGQKNLKSNLWNYQFFQKQHVGLEKTILRALRIIVFLCFVRFLEELRIPISFRDFLTFRR